MITLTLGNVRGFRLNDQDGGWKGIVNVDPFNRMVFWEGLVYHYNGSGGKYGDPCGGFMSWEDMKAKYQVEIVPTAEELVMIERGRLGQQVMIKAKEFTEAVEKWLLNEKAR